MSDIEHMIGILGKDSNCPEIISTLKQLDHSHPVALANYEETTAHAVIQQKGVEFIFEDEAKYKSLKYQEVGDGKLYLTDICLYLDNEDFTPYQGVLPFDISPNDTKNSVHEKLGAPDNVNPYFGHEEWEKDQCIVVVDYNSQDVISSITLVAYTFEEAKEKGLYDFQS